MSLHDDTRSQSVFVFCFQVSVKNGQIRETGVVCSLKEGFGFIKCCDRDLSIFFHFSEVVEQSRIICIGDEVEFTIEEDYHSQRPHATRIRFLPKGTVVFEVRPVTSFHSDPNVFSLERLNNELSCLR